MRRWEQPATLSDRVCMTATAPVSGITLTFGRNDQVRERHSYLEQVPPIGALMVSPVGRWLCEPDGTTDRVIANEPRVV